MTIATLAFVAFLSSFLTLMAVGGWLRSIRNERDRKRRSRAHPALNPPTYEGYESGFYTTGDGRVLKSYSIRTPIIHDDLYDALHRGDIGRALRHKIISRRTAMEMLTTPDRAPTHGRN